VGYFSVVARLQGWLFHKGHKALKYRFYLCVLCAFFVYLVVKEDFFNSPS
jgi:hypothetical protein